MEIRLVVLGAILAILGGFLHMWFQNYQKKKQEDKNFLIKAHDILLIFERIQLPPFNHKINTTELMDRLYQISFKIQRKRYNNLKSEIYNFAKKHRDSYLFSRDGIKPIQDDLNQIKSKLEKEISK